MSNPVTVVVVQLIASYNRIWCTAMSWRRRTHSRLFKRRIIKLSLEPGVSVARIALEHELNANLVFKWRREHLRSLATPAARQATLLPVHLDAPPGLIEAGPIATASTTKPARSGAIELELPGGRIRISGAVDAEALRLVVHLLSAR